MQIELILVFGMAAIGLAVVGLLLQRVLAWPVVDKQAARLAHAIQEGAMTFLREEYRIIAMLVAVISVVLTYYTNWATACGFITGSVCSLITGYLGMYAATQANVRTTIAARDKGEGAAFQIAFFGGGVMGFAVAAIGLLGLGGFIYAFWEHPDFANIIASFGLGASLVAFFARVGGGIFTKSADIGADLVGKVEAGIPEDDPRNPAVIADNVGDCVGDTAGMGADIYESYVAAMISSIVLATTAHPDSWVHIMLPLVISALGLGGSLIGLASYYVITTQPATMLRNATFISVAAFVAFASAYIYYTLGEMQLLYSVLIGCTAGIVVGICTEYYTGGAPIKKLAKSSESGAATNIIYGLSIGMESAVLPIILLGFAVWLSHAYGGGLFGVSIAAVSMLATVGVTMTVDAYGPIADNAGGIAEMAGYGSDVRDITDKLDALGNTTAAIGKGFAIGSALLAALGVFAAYAEQANIDTLNLIDPAILVGIFIGSTMPFLVSSLTMRSVSEAALDMVMEVRRQFREIPGIMESTVDPDYRSCIAISTKASLREMVLPGVITVALPVFVWYAFGYGALGGVIVGATVVGVLLALMMANGGGAWDNAKKYIETGEHGGKGSEAHKAAVVGDTVGDPFKDTSGPALNILIKLLSMVALVLATL